MSKEELLSSYHNLNFVLLPIDYKSKEIKIADWPNKTLEDSKKYNFNRKNVGVVTGHDFFVLDVDVNKKGEDPESNGVTNLERILRENDATLNTPCVRTGSGGYHYYFKMHERITGNKKDVVHNGKTIRWDIKAQRGLIIVPPSRHPNGELYKWVVPLSEGIKDMPDFLLDIVFPLPVVVEQEVVTNNTAVVQHDYSMVKIGDDYLDSLLSCLSEQRVTNYEYWVKVGMALHNQNTDNYELWDHWSKKAHNYCGETKSREKWGTFKRKRKGKVITIGTLKKWARQDNPTRYNMIETVGIKADRYMKLDEIKGDESINLSNIGSYADKFKGCKAVCLKSNAKTNKTQNLRELFKTYKRVLIISFRVSLIEEYYRIFKDEAFISYLDVEEGTIRNNRVIIQIDSIHRIKGRYDLVILDEIEYIREHLFSFVKLKSQCYRTLVEFILNANKVVVCDALLTTSTIDWIKELIPDKIVNGQLVKGVNVVVNEYKSFKNRKLILERGNGNDYIEKIKHYVIDCREKIYCPVNSKTVGVKLLLFLKSIGINAYLLSSDTEALSVDDWGKYDVLITTPTVVAGLSFTDKWFNRRVAYFTNASCDAEMCFQMVLRVRDTNKEDVIICKENRFSFDSYPLTEEGIDDMSSATMNAYNEFGFFISNVTERIEITPYYKWYRGYVQRINTSKLYMLQRLKELFESHGFDVTVVDASDKVTVDIESIKSMFNEEKEITCINVAEAPLIDHTLYDTLKRKHHTTLEEKRMIRKYAIHETYGVEVTPEVVREFGEYNDIKRYNNLSFCNGDLMKGIQDLKYNVLPSIVNFENFDPLTCKHKHLKLYLVLELLTYTGIRQTNNRFVFTPNMNFLLNSYLSEKRDLLSIIFKTNKVNVDGISFSGQRRYLKCIMKSIGLDLTKEQVKYDGILYSVYNIVPLKLKEMLELGVDIPCTKFDNVDLID